MTWKKKTVKLTDESGKVVEPGMKPSVEPVPTPPPEPQMPFEVEGGIKEIQAVVAQLRVDITRMSGLLQGYDPWHRTGYTEGFADGIRYFIKEAEEMAAKHLKFESRQALLDADALPTWWIVTLAKNYFTEYPAKGPEHPVPPTTKKEEHGRRA